MNLTITELATIDAALEHALAATWRDFADGKDSPAQFPAFVELRHRVAKAMQDAQVEA